MRDAVSTRAPHDGLPPLRSIGAEPGQNGRTSCRYLPLSPPRSTGWGVFRTASNYAARGGGQKANARTINTFRCVTGNLALIALFPPGSRPRVERQLHA